MECDKGGLHVDLHRHRYVFRLYWGLDTFAVNWSKLIIWPRQTFTRWVASLDIKTYPSCVFYLSLFVASDQFRQSSLLWRCHKYVTACLQGPKKVETRVYVNVKPCRKPLYQNPVSSRFTAKGLLVWRVAPWPQAWPTQNSSFNHVNCSLNERHSVVMWNTLKQP